jgi:predicted amidohydrolase YtcJ
MFADLVFLNGQVITIDENNRIVEAVAVKENRIMAVGSSREVESLIGDHTETIDLGGKSLLPGFIDAHVHFTGYGLNKLAVSCKEPHIQSIEDIRKDLKTKAGETPKGEWVRAWGFNDTKVTEQRYPTRLNMPHIRRKS